MSWTQGQSRPDNESPFINPENGRESNTPPSSNKYFKANGRRNDYNHRHPQHTQNSQQKDIAATFTQEGLQAFSLIFSSAVEAAIAKSMPDMLDNAIERQFSSVIQQIKNDLSIFAAELVTQIANQIMDTVNAQLSKTMDEPMLNGTEAQSKPAANEYHTGDSDSAPFFSEEVEIAVHALRTIERPVKTSELPSLIQDIKWGSNVSGKMSMLIRRSNGQIVRSGRGMYQYRPLDD